MGAIRGRVVLWLSFVVGLLGVLVVVFVPPVTLSSEYSWDVVRGEPVVTGLVRPAVEEITVVGSCGLGSGATSEVLEADNWSVAVRGQVLDVVSPLAGVPLLEVVLPGSCGFEVAYSLSDMAVTVTVVDDSTGGVVSQESAVVSEAFRVSGFGVSGVGEPVFSQVVVETFPWGLGFSPVRFIGQVLVFGAVGLLVLRTVLRDRASPPTVGDVEVFPRVGSGWSRWTIHGSVLVVLVAGMMLLPSHYDDGWIYQRFVDALGTGLYTNTYDSEDTWFVQGLWMEKIFAGLVFLGASFEVLRLVVVGVLWWGWWFLTRALERLGFIRRVSELVVAGSVFLAFALAFLMTIRPEPVIAVLVGLFFVGFIGFVRELREGYLLLAGIAAVAAGTAHQSGFVLLLPALLLIGFAAQAAMSRKMPWQEFALPIGVVAALGAGLIFFHYDWEFLAGASGDWIGGYEEVTESQRWDWLFSESGWRWWPVAVVGIVALLVPLLFHRLSKPDLLLVAGIFATPVGFFFTASKWSHHVGVLALSTVILLILGLSSLRRVRSLASSLALVSLFIVISTPASIIAIQSTRPFQWSFPHRLYGDGVLEELFPGWNDASIFWLVPVLPVLALTVWVLGVVIGEQFRRVRGVVGLSFVSLLILAPAANHYGALVADSVVYQGWTPFKQRMMNLAGIDNCGLLDDLEIVVDAQPVVQERKGPIFRETGPFGLSVLQIARDQDEIVFETDEMSSQLMFWARSEDGPAEVTLRVQAISSYQTRLEQSLSLSEDFWALIQIPSIGEDDFLTISIQTAEPRGSVWLTEVAKPTTKTALESVADSVILAGPAKSTYISCGSEPANLGGVLEQVDYIISANFGRLYYSHYTKEGVQVSFVRQKNRWPVGVIQVSRTTLGGQH